ncbi:TIGR03617 family F420-dependent LLM class oxidoreductase [Goodfellowiella coeruleoviolacea]|uniref:F420-dependent oxidoreductase, MSMEG_2256 family n=1 Tax=Goodfellowiella coeruleoviolacea TaxID=334858 RepID=A0AAE3GDE7_9PSEU|nr:TIGR03617 family F420-dependent LLM class oxidoreductase [Goodfellowiella coeruleoviolacea]MCP2164098.1 putative F420-dependent oxidoreductase, MSMEG_2256 family [Goodfellowiella coeruleoviolacea]
MRIDYHTISVSPTALADTAREIEDTGYDSLWTSEVQYDPFVGLAVAAQRTERLALRTGIAVAFARNPMTTAMLANDLHLVSGGRFVLGMGSQLKAHITRRFSMPWSHPAARMREYVLAMRAIWHTFATGERLRFRGEFYRHTLMVPFFNPGPNPYGPPPVYLAAVGEVMTEVAGEVGDGLIAHNISTRRFLEEVSLPALRRGRARAGRSMDGFEIHAAPMVATGTTEEEMATSIARIREQIAFYVATPTYGHLLDLHGLSELREELHRLSAEGRVDEMASAIDDDVLNTIAVVGEPKQVAAEILARYGDLVTSLSFYSPHNSDPAAWLPVYQELRRLQEQQTRQTEAAARLAVS